ncbi:hypothetical protein BD560DRAFT_425067 [Blakeslea trispora]|nr:hypothetical protein BD560DRAFT_425067 [Blakeslea trispora]
MKLTYEFVFIVTHLMCTLPIVAADTWKTSMFCGRQLELILEHQNDLGYQFMRWNADQSSFDTLTCSNDGVICVKELVVSRENCEKVSIIFKIQYGNTWSTQNYVSFIGVRNTGFGITVARPYFFNPKFS